MNRVGQDLETSAQLTFLDACERGELAALDQVLAQHASSINVNEHDGEAFVLACAGGHINIITRLLTLTGPLRVIVPHTALTEACSRGHEAVVRLLLAERGARQLNANAANCEALCMACAGGHVGVLRQLLALQGDSAVDVHHLHEAGFRAAVANFARGTAREMLLLEGGRAMSPHLYVGSELRLVARREPRAARLSLAAAVAEHGQAPEAAQTCHRAVAMHAFVRDRDASGGRKAALPRGARPTPADRKARLRACAAYLVLCSVLPAADAAPLRTVLLALSRSAETPPELLLAQALRDAAWRGVALPSCRLESQWGVALQQMRSLGGASPDVYRREARRELVLRRVAGRGS